MDLQNIIFMDGEFAQLKPDGIDLLSIGLVKPTGEELYLELEFDGEIDPWVQKNVVPYLGGEKVSLEEAAQKIKKFVGNSKPYLIAYVNQFDWMGVCKLFDANNPPQISERVPFHWAPVDFSSMLFERGIEPGIPPTKVANQYGTDISDIREHNALDDAKLLKRLYEKIILKK
ncbi:MAG: 3'-5' exoribonuclease [Nanoarchaeota archaeon]|nr:3'-5' exoribonuclease [Nanoarchaeota archaeon]